METRSQCARSRRNCSSAPPATARRTAAPSARPPRGPRTRTPARGAIGEEGRRQAPGEEAHQAPPPERARSDARRQKDGQAITNGLRGRLRRPAADARHALRALSAVTGQYLMEEQPPDRRTAALREAGRPDLCHCGLANLEGAGGRTVLPRAGHEPRWRSPTCYRAQGDKLSQRGAKGRRASRLPPRR